MIALPADTAEAAHTRREDTTTPKPRTDQMGLLLYESRSLRFDSSEDFADDDDLWTDLEERLGAHWGDGVLSARGADGSDTSLEAAIVAALLPSPDLARVSTYSSSRR